MNMYSFKYAFIVIKMPMKLYDFIHLHDFSRENSNILNLIKSSNILIFLLFQSYFVFILSHIEVP